MTRVLVVVAKWRSRTAVLKPFPTYALMDGQQFAPGLELAKLPAKIAALDERTIARIKKT